ncbi:uncharacterized protein BDR25DRAFT_355263 [Lindgomyces ingoldianus]|uniref:Uncharacterized protein n=1 Tax=Lindgomyces ingoldianus TaxID=673940 RepID=A0ACB6QW29_9PLEO|nr:uncharacterized protein BDR25DRAFT_355263 [Lindgomyces ingoldianus]KAF2470783.1 hypothetical protein BDR25DRAFT_355263 [Lindgomyces ingoldianus]
MHGVMFPYFCSLFTGKLVLSLGPPDLMSLSHEARQIERLPESSIGLIHQHVVFSNTWCQLSTPSIPSALSADSGGVTTEMFYLDERGVSQPPLEWEGNVTPAMAEFCLAWFYELISCQMDLAVASFNWERVAVRKRFRVPASLFPRVWLGKHLGPWFAGPMGPMLDPTQRQHQLSLCDQFDFRVSTHAGSKGFTSLQVIPCRFLPRCPDSWKICPLSSGFMSPTHLSTAPHPTIFITSARMENHALDTFAGNSAPSHWRHLKRGVFPFHPLDLGPRSFDASTTVLDFGTSPIWWGPLRQPCFKSHRSASSNDYNYHKPLNSGQNWYFSGAGCLLSSLAIWELSLYLCRLPYDIEFSPPFSLLLEPTNRVTISLHTALGDIYSLFCFAFDDMRRSQQDAASLKVHHIPRKYSLVLSASALCAQLLRLSRTLHVDPAISRCHQIPSTFLYHCIVHPSADEPPDADATFTSRLRCNVNIVEVDVQVLHPDFSSAISHDTIELLSGTPNCHFHSSSAACSQACQRTSLASGSASASSGKQISSPRDVTNPFTSQSTADCSDPGNLVRADISIKFGTTADIVADAISKATLPSPPPTPALTISLQYHYRLRIRMASSNLQSKLIIVGTLPALWFWLSGKLNLGKTQAPGISRLGAMGRTKKGFSVSKHIVKAILVPRMLGKVTLKDRGEHFETEAFSILHSTIQDKMDSNSCPL